MKLTSVKVSEMLRLKHLICLKRKQSHCILIWICHIQAQ